MGLMKLLTLFSWITISVCLECGQYTNYNNMLTERIVNGDMASVGEFPWQVSIQRSTGIRIPFARQWMPGPATWPSPGSWQQPVLHTIQARPTPTPPGGWPKPVTNRPVPYPPGSNPFASTTSAPHRPTVVPQPVPTIAPQPHPQPNPQPTLSPAAGRWNHFCGGSIISENWILTAAHCVENFRHGSYTPGSIRIVLGTTDWRNANNGKPQIIPIQKIVVHERWDRGSGQNDIALLQTSTPIQFHKTPEGVITVNKVCLSKDTNEYSGNALSSGWGYLSKNSRTSPDLLRKVDMPIVDFRTCHNAFSRVIEVTSNQVCAGQAPKGNCMGDSGGPLVQVSGNKATQIGIVSFSIPCAVHGYPDVFTKVSKYLNWISQHTSNAIGYPSMG